MQRLVAFILPALLAGCGNAMETKIADIDFSDPAAVQRATNSLEWYEGRLFAHYAQNRTNRAASPDNEITRPDGTPPATVAEAVVLTRDWLAKSDARGRLRDQLVDQRNALVEEQNKLLSQSNALLGTDGRIRDKLQYDEVQFLIAADRERIADLEARLAGLEAPETLAVRAK